MRTFLRTLALLAATGTLALGAVACSSDTSTTDTGIVTHPDASATPDAAAEPDAGQLPDAGAAPDAEPAPDATVAPDGGAAPDAGGYVPSPQAPEDCDPIQPEVCAFPWPSNLYLKEDVARVTGYTLTFGATTLPENKLHQRIDPAPYTRLDGYGLGEPAMVLFPNLDATSLPDESAIARSLDADAKILFFKEGSEGLVRVPYFAELDSHETDPAKRTLFVRPAALLEENTRYVVAFRNLTTVDGAAIPPSEAFAHLVAGTTSADPLLAPRQARFDRTFLDLEAMGVPRESLTLAWDFRTASTSALTGVMLSMRDQALTAVGESGPEITITATTAYIPADDGSGRPVDANIAYQFTGTIQVPRFLRSAFVGLLQGEVLNLDADGSPRRSGSVTLPFWLRVPYSAVTSTATHDLMQFGHGLLGSGADIDSGHMGVTQNTHHFVAFSCSTWGMSEDDLQIVGASVQDFSAFPFLADRLYQGMLNHLILARAMKGRLAALPHLVSKGVHLSDRLYYNGNSQGGIFGATITALSTDLIRSHLGVPGQNYSTLLHRSVDFTQFFELVQENYPRPVDQALALSAAQLLWNGTDPVTFYRHLAVDPLPGTPRKDVLISIAKGDHQVAPLTMEIVARSYVGVPIMLPYDASRTPFDVATASYPRQGSGMVLWDFGNPWPTPGNHVPEDTMEDPHGKPRRMAIQQEQLQHFLRTGEIIDVCGGDGCRPD